MHVVLHITTIDGLLDNRRDTWPLYASFTGWKEGELSCFYT